MGRCLYEQQNFRLWCTEKRKFSQMLEERSFNLPAPEPLPGRSVLTSYLLLMMRFHYSRTSWNYFQEKIWIFLLELATTSFRMQDEFQKKSPISLHSKEVRQPAMAVSALHNWLQIGQLKTLYMLPEFCDIYDPATQSFIPSSRRKENNHFCLIQL